MKRLTLLLIFLSLLFSVAGQDTVEQEISMESGWNTIGINVQDAYFSEDIQSQCDFGWWNQDISQGTDPADIEDDERYYVWEQTGGEWSHPDYLSPSKGYSLYTNEDCTISLEGEPADVQQISIRSGWNIINLQNNEQVNTVWDQCNGENGLSWWNNRLAEDENAYVPEPERYYFWTANGGRWNHAYQKDYTLDSSDGVYVYGSNSCTVDFSEDSSSGDEEPKVPDYINLEDSTLQSTDIGDGNNLTINLATSLNDPEDIGARPTFELLKNGVSVAEKRVNWNAGTLEFAWEEIWSGNSQDNVEFVLKMQRNREGDYHWDRQTDQLGTASITRCGPNHVYNEFHANEGISDYSDCIAINEELVDERDSIASGTGWNLRAETGSVHTLESIGTTENEESRTLSIDTGNTGFCGKVYFENTYTGSYGEITINTESESLLDNEYDDQEPQKFFIEVNGERIASSRIAGGDSESFGVELSEGDDIKVGIDGDLGNPEGICGLYHSRTSLSMDIPGDFSTEE